MYDRYSYYFFQLTNQIINHERKAKTSKTNYLAHTRQNFESFLSQMQYIISLNLKQSSNLSVRVSITCSTPDAPYEGKDDSAICCVSLHYILTSNKVCITCQSLAHTMQAWRANWWKALHLHHKCYTLHDNLKTTLEQINTSKCSLVLRNMYRRTPNIDWRQVHIPMLCVISVDVSIHIDILTMIDRK